MASPATVSRCGMVYLEPHQLGWRPLCLSWLNTFPESLQGAFKERVLALFDWLVPVSLRFLRREIKEAAGTTEEGTNVIVNLMRTFKSLLVVPLAGDNAVPGMLKGLEEEALMRHVDSVFIFSLTWQGGYRNQRSTDVELPPPPPPPYTPHPCMSSHPEGTRRVVLRSRAIYCPQ